MSRFTDEQLMDLLEQGKTQRECAAILGVAEETISRRKKKISERIAKDVSLFSAGRLLDKQILRMETLFALSSQTQDLLEMINVILRSEDEYGEEYRTAERRLRRLVGSGRKGQQLSKFLIELQSELRRQLESYFVMQEKVYNLKRIKEFQDEVMEAIKEADPDVARRITHKLIEVQQVRQALEPGEKDGGQKI